jgi:hypothetical protein
MLQAISERLANSLDRRSFLSRAAYATGAMALTLLGVTPAYATFDILGCNLCKNPATCSYDSCACEWSWPGTAVPDDTGCRDFYICFECYTSSGCPAAGGCNGVKCSKLEYDHTSCGPGGGGGGHCKPRICK